jgi:glycosyltransferase involved in cell wall biosynthesis
VAVHKPIGVAVLTQQISHYHAARYVAAKSRFDRFRVFSAMNSADFSEFLSNTKDPDIVRLFEGKGAYARAAFSGKLWHDLHDQLDRFKPDVVVVAGWSFSESLAAIAWARRTGARVAVMSDSQVHDAERHPWREAIKSRVVSACDAALVAAAPHREYAMQLGIPGERIFFGYDAVDNAHFSGGADYARKHARIMRTSRGLPERYLLASGRFIPKKNFPRLVEAFALALRSNDLGHDLVILGDGRERAQVERMAHRHRIAHRVRLPGFRAYDSLPMFYGLSSGFVHTPLAEQWGLVVNEAAAAGVPLIVSQPCGAASALVEIGRNGFTVDPTATADISRALGQLMNLSDDERWKMGMESRRIVADWSPERYAEGLRSACDAALVCAPRTLGIVDRVLLRALSHMRITRVQ